MLNEKILKVKVIMKNEWENDDEKIIKLVNTWSRSNTLISVVENVDNTTIDFSISKKHVKSFTRDLRLLNHVGLNAYIEENDKERFKLINYLKEHGDTVKTIINCGTMILAASVLMNVNKK